VGQVESKAQAIVPEYVQLNAAQLDQLVAPIALDPDPLVAQILIGSTFPDQVDDANGWLTSKMNLLPDQRAAGVSNMSWDPSIKGLTVFPLVLDSMAKNTAWTTQLGNAYYNQPDDVMDAIQAMRLAAFQTHVLVETSRETIQVTDDVIEIVPVNPDVIYVQAYNPWLVWGTLVEAYPGFVEEPVLAGFTVADGVSFDPPVSVAADAQFGFNFGGWGPGWGGGAVVYNNNVYNSNSRTVAGRGHFGGHDGRAFEHGGRGVPAGFHPGSHGGFDRGGFDHRGFDSRSISRVSDHRPSPMNRSGMNGRTNTMNRASAFNRGANQRAANNNRAANQRTGQFNRAANRNVASNRMAAPSRATSPARNAGANRNVASARTTPNNRSTALSSNRSTMQNRSVRQPAPAARSNAFNSSMSRSTPAARPSAGQSPSRASNSFAANRPAANPAANRPGGFGGAMNHAPAANNAMGAGHATARPASMAHAGGGGFGGHMGKR
jgi:hypothetical protein